MTGTPDRSLEGLDWEGASRRATVPSDGAILHQANRNKAWRNQAWRHQALRHPAWEATARDALALLDSGATVVAILGRPGTGKSLMLGQLSATFRGRAPAGVAPDGLNRLPEVTVLDEADRADDATLLGLRTPALLAGLPLLEERLLALGIEAKFLELRPLRPEEVLSFLQARLAAAGRPADCFAPDAVTALVALSGGVPRQLNSLIGGALFTASMDGSSAVTAQHVGEAAAMRGEVATTPPVSEAAVPSAATPHSPQPDEATPGAEGPAPVVVGRGRSGLAVAAREADAGGADAAVPEASPQSPGSASPGDAAAREVAPSPPDPPRSPSPQVAAAGEAAVASFVPLPTTPAPPVRALDRERLVTPLRAVAPAARSQVPPQRAPLRAALMLLLVVLTLGAATWYGSWRTDTIPGAGAPPATADWVSPPLLAERNEGTQPTVVPGAAPLPMPPNAAPEGGSGVVTAPATASVRESRIGPAPGPARPEEVPPTASPAPSDAATGRPIPGSEPSVPAGGLRIVIHRIRGAGSGAERVASDLLAPFGDVEIRTVAASVRLPTIRYYHEADAEPAARMARVLAEYGAAWRVQEMTSFRPLPRPGTVEVWLP